MPPAQPSGYYELPGKPHGTVKTVPYKPAVNLHFPQLLLTSRLFVGRGLDPSLLFCGYHQFPRRGGITPPYIVISSQLPLPASLSYKCARAARTPYLLSIISYLLFRLPLRGNLVPDGAPTRNVPGNCNKKQPYVFRKAVPWCTLFGTLPRPKNAPLGRFCPAVR